MLSENQSASSEEGRNTGFYSGDQKALFYAVLKFAISHVFAGIIVIFGSLFVTFSCYIITLIMNPHGIDNPIGIIPEVLALMFTAGLFAAGVSIASFVLSIILTWIRSKKRFHLILPILVTPILTFVIVSLIFREISEKGVFTTVVLCLYFGVYWIALASSDVVIALFRKNKMERGLKDVPFLTSCIPQRKIQD